MCEFCMGPCYLIGQISYQIVCHLQLIVCICGWLVRCENVYVHNLNSVFLCALPFVCAACCSLVSVLLSISRLPRVFFKYRQ